MIAALSLCAVAPTGAQAGAGPQTASTLHVDVESESGLRVRLLAADLHIVGADTRQVLVHLDQPGAVRMTDEVSLARGADGHLTSARRDSATSAALRLRVTMPRAMAIEHALIDSGRVVLEGLRGQVSVHVVRGTIDASDLRGRVRLEVDTGDITARAVRLADGQSLKCRTFNGDVRIELAGPPANARILALTLNGAVVSSVPLATRAAFGPRFSEATFGAGEHVLSIDVVRGESPSAITAADDADKSVVVPPIAPMTEIQGRWTNGEGLARLEAP